MPTRTAFIITIGDVLESGPPRSRASKAVNGQSSGVDDIDESPPSSRPHSPASSTYSDAPRPRRFRKRNKMKTRVSNTGGASANVVVNGASNGGRRSRLQSVDQVYLNNSNNNPLSPRTRSSVKQEVDEEISFADPLSTEDEKCNGVNGFAEEPEEAKDTVTEVSSNAIKKKRKSSAEKFLEDNSEYYGFQVLPSKLRSSSVDSSTTTTSFPNPFLDFLNRSNSTTIGGDSDNGAGISSEQTQKLQHDHDERRSQRHRSASSSLSADPSVDGIKGERSRHSSGASSTKRRIRANSSSSNHHGECLNATKKLRVEVTKMEIKDSTTVSSDHSGLSSSEEQTNDQNGDRPLRKKLRSRRNNAASLSPSSKKRRSELDKLLEAGLSSFHCETAKQAADRMGPLQVDVSDNSSETGSVEEAKKAARGSSSRLLQEADVNQNSKGGGKKGKAVPKTSKKVGAKKGRRKRTSGIKSEPEENEDETLSCVSPVSSCVSPNFMNSMEDALKRVDSNEVEISSMEFSFERTPHREGWFQTYSRQDQGDEILFYPDHLSFPLPYEMPMSTFYPRKEGGATSKKAGKTTPTISGTATPIEEEEEPLQAVRTTRGKSSNNAAATGKKNLNNILEGPSFFDKIDPKKAAALRAAEFSRKSPRGHASTKSLLNSASPYVDDMDDEVFEDLIDGAKRPVGYAKSLAYLDECSNDSMMSTSSKKGVSESVGQFEELANNLDSILCEEDPMLLPIDAPTSDNNHSSSKKRSRRQSSSDKGGSKKHRKPKESNEPESILDRLVDNNVDPVFLDCLEDELPSVVFDEAMPGSDPMDLIFSYENCTSMKPLGRKKKLAAKVMEADEPRSSVTMDPEPLVVCHSKDPSSTILRRLLTDPAKRKGKKSGVVRKQKASLNAIPASADDSSSECASNCETASVASSSASRHKKRRNLTGFPSVKKKKTIPKNQSKLINNNGVAAPRPSTPKTLIKPPLKPKLGRPSKADAAAKKGEKGPPTSKPNNRIAKAVQLQLKLGSNGISLQKPTKSPPKKGGLVKRGRPLSKSKQPSRKVPVRTSKAAAVALPKQAPPSSEIIDILSSDDDDFDDDDDCTFRPRMSTKKIAGKKTKRSKKKNKRSLVLKKPKRSQVPVKVITIDDDDEGGEAPANNDSPSKDQDEPVVDVDTDAGEASNPDKEAQSESEEGDSDEDEEESEDDSEEAEESSSGEENEESESGDDNESDNEADGSGDDDEDQPISKNKTRASSRSNKGKAT